jgi:hypothetical protein
MWQMRIDTETDIEGRKIKARKSSVPKKEIA